MYLHCVGSDVKDIICAGENVNGLERWCDCADL